MNRRTFLGDTGMGFTGMALSAMMFKNGEVQAAKGWAPPTGKPYFPAKAKSVIWIFNIGGVSHLEGFDPKPALNTYAGKMISETPYADRVLNKDTINKNLLDPSKQKREIKQEILGLQTVTSDMEKAVLKSVTGFRTWDPVRMIYVCFAACGRLITITGRNSPFIPGARSPKVRFRQLDHGRVTDWGR